MWNLLIVLASIVLTANSGPVHPVVPSVNPLHDDILLSVLDECKRPKENSAEKKLCDLYLSVVQNDSTTVISNDEFKAVLAHPEPNTKDFCGRLLQYPVQNFIPKVGSCEIKCRKYDGADSEYVDPLCRLILWRLDVQRAGQIPPSVGEMSAPAATQEGLRAVQEAKTSITVGNTTSQGSEANQKLPMTPSGGSADKVEIPLKMPPMPPKPSTEGSPTLPKAIAEIPKKAAELPVASKEAEKVKEPVVEVPKTHPEEKTSNQPTPEDPKPPEEVKNPPELRPEDEDPLENKEIDEDGNLEEYSDGNVEDAVGRKNDPDNLDAGDAGLPFDKSDVVKDVPVPDNKMELVETDPFQDPDKSNFFTYFMALMAVCILAYVVYHNKTKVLALVLEGRRSSQGRGRRKHTAAYRKLDSNLEEAITSSAASRTTQIIY
ncbi:trans-Golgi network integral membrane protein 1-like [Phlebotomus argentipes]|uniref:trans-Golgi network integral membrane protein 1-like n=1 Tax=Phlebotomus argentipes TaxID=94469 RepID=UPI0028931634|nr:trans-Golgi network integral membrane protein 1-like [Phlebotomus argentipes]